MPFFPPMGNLGFKAGDEFFDGAVVRPLGRRGKETTRKLPALAVVGYTFTAFSPAGADVIRTGTILQILLQITIHLLLLGDLGALRVWPLLLKLFSRIIQNSNFPTP